MTSKIATPIFTLGIISALSYYVFREDLILLIIILVGYFLLFNSFKNLKGNLIYIIVFLYLFTLIYAFKLIYYQELLHFIQFLLFISQLGYVNFILTNKDSLKIIKSIYLLVVLILFIYFFNGIHPSQISNYSSENGVNAIVLLFSILLIAINFYANNKIIIYPAFVSLLISIWTLGRSGIIASLVLLLGIIIIKSFKNLSKFKFSLIIFFTVSISFYIAPIINLIIESLITRFGTRNTFIEGDPRVYIMEEYLERLNIAKLMLGTGNEQELYFGYLNLHNGFLEIHHFFGLGGILVILLYIGALLFNLFKRQYLLFLLLISLFIRISTDTFVFVFVYDFIVLYIIMSSFYKYKIEFKYKKTDMRMEKIIS